MLMTAVVCGVGESILSHHLSHLPKPITIPNTITIAENTTLSSTSQAIQNTTTSTITKALEQDLGVTLREALSNAAETGMEEQMDEVVDVAQVLMKGGEGMRVGV
jgi:hypothetical protein